MSLESKVSNLAIRREIISKISLPFSSFGKSSLRRPWSWTFVLCIVVRVGGGVQQGANLCRSVLFKVRNLAIRSVTVFQNSSSQFWKMVSREPWNWTFSLCMLITFCTPSSRQLFGGFHNSFLCDLI